MNASLTRFGHAAAAAHAPFIAAALAGLGRAWQQLREGFARRRRLARMEAAIAGLDDATLRDLGVHRTEIASFWAEGEGLAAPTRQRLYWLGHARVS
jgi:uncharacterized protein YjiS (DUF1127 family)